MKEGLIIMVNKKILSSVLGSLGVLAVASTITVNSKASTYKTTPMLSYRYSKKTANYHDKSTSAHYKYVWKKAVEAWKQKGFRWTSKGSSKTNLTSYSDSSKKGLTIAGYDAVRYNPSNGYIIRTNVMINRAFFEKYGYSTDDQIHVAEHELGHALGLAHNKVNSKSVMNPANRFYGIQPCDVRGMNKRYSTAIDNDSVNPNQYVDVIEYMKVKPRVSRVSYKYNATNKQLLIKGQAEGFSKIAVKYGHNRVRIFKVDKHSAFNVKYHFKGYGTFTVYGVNRKGKIVSNKYKIGSNKYATENPVVYKNTRNKNGEKIYLSNVAPSTIRVFNKGKLVKEFVADSSGNTIFISQKKLRKSNSITIDQKEFHKKTSVRVKVPKLSIGENNVINY
ncbi:matrixin family metalloprotease [Apilactobacillus kunkeei]|nr:M57 family metalloprotease [Apilactobacillus kunkeei]